MLDREIVAAVVAGDPAGLAAAYDRYAPSLYAYCQSLLSEPADAADAVQDTFIIAAAKLSALRDQDRLRPWLYAVARNECHRRLRSAGSAAPLDEAAGVTDGTNDLGSDLEQAELREVVWSALGGLSSSEREIIELNLGHELDGADLADALGVPRNQAHAMASRARAHFESALGVLLVARSGREACPELAGILEGWDGRLTVLLRKRVGRHIRRCGVCGDRQRRELSPVTLLSVLPIAALPAALRHQVLGLIADSSPGAVAQRLAVGQRAGPLGPGGFPRPLNPPSPVRLHHLAHGPRRRGEAPPPAGRRSSAGPSSAAACCTIATRPGRPGPGPRCPPAARRAPRARPRRPRPARAAPGRGPPRPGRRCCAPGPRRQRQASASTAPAGPGGSPGPGHLGGSLARDIGRGRGHPDRVTGQPGAQAVPGRRVDRDADPDRPRRAGVRLPRRRARAAAPGPHPQPGLRITGRRAECPHHGDRRRRPALFSTALLTVSPGGLSVPVTYNLLG